MPQGPQGFRHVRRPQEQRQLNLQILRLFFGRRRVHCGNPWVDEHGREWVTVEICNTLKMLTAALTFLSTICCSVTGHVSTCYFPGADSFLTHQIRKMIATAALVKLATLI